VWNENQVAGPVGTFFVAFDRHEKLRSMVAERSGTVRNQVEKGIGEGERLGKVDSAKDGRTVWELKLGMTAAGRGIWSGHCSWR